MPPPYQGGADGASFGGSTISGPVSTEMEIESTVTTMIAGIPARIRRFGDQVPPVWLALVGELQRLLRRWSASPSGCMASQKAVCQQAPPAPAARRFSVAFMATPMKNIRSTPAVALNVDVDQAEGAIAANGLRLS